MSRIPTFVNTKTLCAETGLNPTQLKLWRAQGRLIRGVHVQYVTPRALLYNLPLCLDLIANTENPAAHQRAIHAFREAQAANSLAIAA